MLKKKYMIIVFLALCLAATVFLTMATTNTASSSEYTPSAPIGTIIPWAKNLAGVPSLPDDFVECNGQTLNDTESPLHGQVIPNLNGFDGGTQRLLRGATSSGNTGGRETHQHYSPFGWNPDSDYIRCTNRWGSSNVGSGSTCEHVSVGGTFPYVFKESFQNYPLESPKTSPTSTLPSYYEVVWIMRVKYSAPESVGGLTIPVGKLGLLAPYIISTMTIILAVSISVAYVKYRKKQ